MRKKRVLLLLMAGVACLIGVIIGAVYAINCHFPPIYIPFKICIGEGGVLRRVDKVVAHDCDDEIEYSAYIGNARCFSGHRIRGMLLVLERVPENAAKRYQWYPWEQLLVGRNHLSQGIFPTQGLNPGLLHCRQVLYHLNHQGSPQPSLGSR